MTNFNIEFNTNINTMATRPSCFDVNNSWDSHYSSIIRPFGKRNDGKESLYSKGKRVKDAHDRCQKLMS